MPADYSGTWEMVSNDKFDDVMKAMGKSFCLLQLLNDMVGITWNIQKHRAAHKFYSCAKAQVKAKQ